MTVDDAIRVICDTISSSGGQIRDCRFGNPGDPVSTRDTSLAVGDDPARSVQVRLNGWGTAFEEQVSVIPLTCDLQSSPDELVKSVLAQANTALSFQRLQAAGAAAAGIRQPLGRQAFADLRRLKIDLVAAETLHHILGSDSAVRAWLTEQLSIRWDHLRPRRTETHLDVHGLVVAVKFALNPMEIVARIKPRPGRALWIDNQIRGCRDNDEHGASTIADELPAPLRSRRIVERFAWPDAEFMSAMQNIPRRSKPNHGSRNVRREWRVIFERRLIGVDEAFG